MTKSWLMRPQPGNDEIYLSYADVRELVNGVEGTHRLSFVIDERVIDDQLFTVTAK
jgi:hypothetical protein